MPNHVTNKILFAAKHATTVFPAVCPGGIFDFELLVASPPNMYRGHLSSEDDKDFRVNWGNWCVQNWGTKWNAYNCSTGFETDLAFITFDTAWAPPYPILAAFCNRFEIPFEHRWSDEGTNHWGVEMWDKDRDLDHIQRVSKRVDDEADKVRLCLELKGYDPSDEDQQ